MTFVLPVIPSIALALPATHIVIPGKIYSPIPISPMLIPFWRKAGPITAAANAPIAAMDMPESNTFSLWPGLYLNLGASTLIDPASIAGLGKTVSAVMAIIYHKQIQLDNVADFH